MFPALLCSSSGGQNCIIQPLVSSQSVGGRPVHRCTGRPPTDCSNHVEEYYKLIIKQEFVH